MSDIANLDPHDLYHAPHLMGETVHRVEAVIAAAAALQRWDDLDKAVDFLIECQQVIVRWWDDHVAANHWPHTVSGPETVISVADAREKIGADKVRISRWRTALKSLDAYRERIAQAARRKAELEAAENHRAQGTGENEWFTPPEYIEAAREVMGDIDLDPATHATAQHTIQAARYYTKEDDGLTRPWYGRVWLNPPYAQPYITKFIDRLVQEFEAGSVRQAILLTHNYTDTMWFHKAAGRAVYLCFTRGRIKFIDISGQVCAPTQGQAFFYFGTEGERFADVFRRFGFIR